jgi:hypothetical protein
VRSINRFYSIKCLCVEVNAVSIYFHVTKV